jgi:hypothetical protein
MKEAPECLERASICDTLARRAQDASSVRVLRDLANQWRRMATDADRYKRLSPGWGGESRRTRVRA